MLSFEIVPAAQGEMSEELRIYFDVDGREHLIKQLMKIRSGSTDHVHLMCESWGGDELDERPIEAGNSSIRHVKITEIIGGETED
jgi:hypothetical protein